MFLAGLVCRVLSRNRGWSLWRGFGIRLDGGVVSMFVFVFALVWWCGRNEGVGVGIWWILWVWAQRCSCEWRRGSMLSLDIDVTVAVHVVVVVVATVSVVVSVERIVLDSKAERMFERDHAWP